MFADLFLQRVKNASEESLRQTLTGMIMDLEATDQSNIPAEELKQLMFENLEIYLSR